VAILRWLALAALTAAAGAATIGGCFSPNQPGCAFSCVADGICPAGYSCAGDGLCHRKDGLGVCDIPPQTDAGSENDADGDAGSDAASDGG
jgi:hypothetical protein